MSDRFFRTYVSDCQPYSARRMNLSNEEFAVCTFLEAESWGSTDSPPGVIYFLSLENLAAKIGVEVGVLKTTIEKLRRIKEVRLKVQKGGRNELSFINWDKKQHPFLSQNKYRERQREGKRSNLQAETAIAGYSGTITDDNPAITSGREKEREKEKEKEIGNREQGEGEGKGNGKTPPSAQSLFYLTLQEFSESHPYPFSEEEEKQAFSGFFEKYPNIDFVSELKKKIEFWKSNPGALKTKGKSPRSQLFEFLLNEIDFRSRQRDS